MVDLLYCELLKLKRSKMLVISFLGALVTPSMVMVAAVKSMLENPNRIIAGADMLYESNMYMHLLFSLVVYAVIGAYLFSREYTENTLKAILTVPVSKTAFLTGKFLMLLIWCLFLTLFSWVFTIFFAIVIGADGLTAGLLFTSLKEFLLASFLLYLTLSPFIFLTLRLKSIVPPIIAAAAMAMGNVALSNESLAALFPWSSSYLLATGQIEESGYPLSIVIGLLAATALSGVMASLIYFQKQDVK